MTTSFRSGERSLAREHEPTTQRRLRRRARGRLGLVARRAPRCPGSTTRSPTPSATPSTPRSSSRSSWSSRRAPEAGTVAVVAFALCALVELAQLTGIPAAVVDAVPVARYALGTTFAAVDLLAYAVGAALGVASCDADG